MDNTCKLVLELTRPLEAKPDPHRDAINEITDVVVELVLRGIEDHQTGFKELCPKTLISVIVNNIMLNLFLCAVKDKATLDIRLKMAQSLIDDTSELFMTCYEKIIMAQAETVGGEH